MGHPRSKCRASRCESGKAADAADERRPSVEDLVEEVVKKVLKALETEERKICCWNCGEMRHPRSKDKANLCESVKGPNHYTRQESKVAMVHRMTVTDDEWQLTKVLREQEEDPDLKHLWEWKRSDGRRPPWQEVAPLSPAVKTLWAQWDSILVDDGVLKRAFENAEGGKRNLQLLVPRKRVPEVLRQLHDGVSGGHLGVHKTLEKVREKFYWPNLKEDVKTWCRNCAVCAAANGPVRRSRAPMKKYDVGSALERVAVDVAGPFPVTNDVISRIREPGKGKPRVDYFNRLARYHGDNGKEETQKARALHTQGVKVDEVMLGGDAEENFAGFERVYKDLFTLPNEYALAHCVSQDLRMARGIATVFRKKFGQIEDLESQAPAVGKTLHLQHGDRHLFYLVTKDRCHEKPTYRALWECLERLRDYLLQLGIKKLGIPKLGCGYDGLDWKIVRSMLEKIFRTCGIDIRVCVFNPWQTEAEKKPWDPKPRHRRFRSSRLEEAVLGQNSLKEGVV